MYTEADSISGEVVKTSFTPSVNTIGMKCQRSLEFLCSGSDSD